MKSVIANSMLAMSMLAFAGTVSASVTCEAVKAKIEAKLLGKGVKAYTLTIVPKDEASDLRVVGTCDGGAKKILYKRG